MRRQEIPETWNIQGKAGALDVSKAGQQAAYIRIMMGPVHPFNANP